MPRSRRSTPRRLAVDRNLRVSLRPEFPGRREKRREFRRVSLFFAKIRLENICEFSRLRMNSLRERAGNFFARAGNFFGAQGMSREFRAKTDSLAPTRQKCLHEEDN